MKKIISIMMSVFMVLSMICVASADGAAIPVQDVSVVADIKVKTTTSSTYSDSISSDVSALPSVNAKATLDMSGVKNILTTLLNTTDGAAKVEEFKADGYVRAEITVTVKYPKALSVEKDAYKFSYETDNGIKFSDATDASSIYRFVSSESTSDTDSTTITYKLKVKDDLKLSELITTESGSPVPAKVLDNIVLSSDSHSIAIPAFDTEYKIEGDVKCVATIYKKSGTTDTDVKQYNFTGSDAATVKFTESSSPSSPSHGVGGGSVVTKVTVKSSVPSGEIPSGTKVKLTATPTTAKIYYTTDGTEPSVTNGKLDGTTKLYSSELTITENTTLKAIAVSSNGKTKSAVGTWEYTVTGVDVSISPKSGNVKEGALAEITSKNGKDIYYTTDGTEPALDENGEPSGTTKKYTEAIAINEAMTIKAFAVNEEGVSSVVATESYTIAPELTSEHIAYIKGYPDGTFGPDLPITRAEVASIFSRLTVKKMDIATDAVSSFSDVDADAWYANAVAFMEQEGIVKGYEDGTFKPDNQITRAEFAVIASRFYELEEVNENIFEDVTSEHWAFFEINSAYKNSLINGYEGNTFKPDNKITRAEVVTIINRMTGRNAEAEFENADLSGLIIFSDVADESAHWAFYDVVEASNTHDYEF